MGDQILKDRRGKRIGKIKTKSNGDMEIYDRRNKRLGKYDSSSDKTKDRRGKTIGKGNLLTTLLSDT